MNIICPHCSRPISLGGDATPDAADALDGSTVADEREHRCSRVVPRQRLGKLELLERVGAGAFGEVWKARDRDLGRLVAVKIPHAGLVSTPTDRERFLREGRSAAHLRHPGIVAVHEVGHEEGLPYLVCDFIHGLTLAELLGRRQLTFHEAAGLVAQLADALDYAHSQGVVHRDIKPSNIMLEHPADGDKCPDALGRPLLTDFGLALRLDADRTLTQEGQVLGTPAYMSPELAAGRGHRVDGRSDVYSLGVVLYQLLAGELPFRGHGRMLMEQVLHDDPRPPRRLDDAIPTDLQTVTLQCLAKEPAHRYRTAGELAADLRRFLAGEPIRARPAGRAERLWRWCRRNPVVAGLSAAVALLLLAAAVGGAVASARLARAARAAEDARRQEEAARRAEELTLADLHTSQGVMAGERGRPADAVLWFAHAARLGRGDPVRQHDNRVRARTWARQAPAPVRAFPHPGQEVLHLAFDPGGQYLLTLTLRDRCMVWDVEGDRPLPWARGDRPVSAAAWDPRGRWLALGTPSGEVEVRGVHAGDLLHRLKHPDPVRALAASPDGRYLAVGGDCVRVWDSQTRDFLPSRWPHPRPVVTLTFNPAGDRLLTGCLDGRARLFAVPGQEAGPLFEPVPHDAEFALAVVAPAILRRRLAPTFVAGGRGFLTRSAAGSVTWRDAQTGAKVRELPFPAGEAQFFEAAPGGDHFVVGGYTGAQLWDAAAGPPPLLPSRNFVTSAAFSPDGSALLTAGGDRTAQLWSVPTGRPLGPPLLHQNILTLAAYSPDGRLAATAQADGLVRVWAPPRGNLRDRRLTLPAGPTFARLSPDGRYVIATGAGWRREGLAAARVFALDTGLPAGPLLEGDGLLTNAALAPDGPGTGGTVAALYSSTVSEAERYAPVVEPEGRAGCLQLWDWRRGKRRHPPIPMPSEPRGVCYSPDGSRVVVICGGGQVLVIDPARGRVLRRLEHGFRDSSYNTYSSALFTPDGQSFITWGPDAKVRVWEAATGRPRCPPLEHGGLVQDAACSQDGRLLVTAGRDNTARVWDLTTGRPAADPLRHPDWVFAARLSPDGRQVLTACRDGTARLWDWRTGRPVCPPFKHGDEVFGAAFSADGRWVLTTGRDRTARLWEYYTGRPVTPPLPLGGWGWTALLTPDGATAVVAGESSSLSAFDLGDLTRPDELSPDDLCLLGEVLSGQRIDGGDVTPLTSEEWLQRWSTFRERHPRHELFEPTEGAAWHEGRAGELEAAGRWREALWHLDRLIAVRPDQWPLHVRRAGAHAALRQWDRAAADYTRAIDLGADDPAVCLARAGARAEQGQWEGAAADYARAVEKGATSVRVVTQHALLRLAVGDRKGYRRACGDLVERFARTENLKAANNVAWVSAYAPGTVGDPARVVGLARKAAAGHPNKYVTLNTLGAALYRAGRFEEAVEKLEASMKAHPGGGAPFDYLFLAMAHHRQGHAGEARRWLGRADDWIRKVEQGKAPDASVRLPLFWIQRLELQLLRREAEGLVKGKTP